MTRPLPILRPLVIDGGGRSLDKMFKEYFPDLKHIERSGADMGRVTFVFEDGEKVAFVQLEFERLEKYDAVAMLKAFRRNK